ncbi:MAG: restriction endonuclease subunit S [Candidatus Thorarchaeota archaeon]
MIGYKESLSGLIPEYWDEISLTKVIDKYIDNRGKTVPVIDEVTKMVLIATNCIKEENLYPVKEKVRYVPDEIYKNWFRGHPEPGDIIIVNKGTPGLVSFVPDEIDFCIAQDMVAIRINMKLMYNKFLFAYMRSRYFKWQVYSLNVGTTIPHLKKTYFKELIIPKPPMPEQIFIGDLYFSISRKIDLLRRQNETLEQIAQTLFKHWFVDFEFPDENGRPYKSSGGEMLPSELGEVPRGWEYKSIDELDLYITDLVANGSFAKLKENVRTYDDVSYALFIRNTDLKSNFKNKVYVDKASYDFLSKSKLFGGEIIISNVGDIGSVHLCPFFKIPMTLGNNCILVKSKNFHYWLYTLFKSKIGYNQLKSAVVGSVQEKLSKTNFKLINIIFPKMDILTEFENLVEDIYLRIFSNKDQINNLVDLRNLLLPKLISGKIRIRE